MMEVDQGGNLLRRVGAKGFPVARFGGNCPKLAIHAAFSTPAEILAERVITPEGDVFLTMSRTVDGPQAGAGERPKRTAVLLGIEDAYATAIIAAQDSTKVKRGTVIMEQEDMHARSIAHARLIPDPANQSPVPIGPACRLCERQDCIARSAPPLTRPLGLDDLVQGFGAYGLT